MNKTIHQLDEVESLATSDELAIWDNSASGTKKVPASEIKSLVITATSTTVTGAKLMAGSVVKILFISAITGSDTTTGLSISYNGTSIPVKVGKDGSLADLVAHDIGGTYTYLQAYTTLELAYDGTQFIVIGNPVVISNSDYTIYADGKTIYKTVYGKTSNSGYLIVGDILINFGVVMTDVDSYVALPHRYSHADYTLVGKNGDDSVIRGNKFFDGFGTSVSNSLCNYIAVGRL